MSKIYPDCFARSGYSKYERLVLRSKMLSVNRFTFLLTNIKEEYQKSKENQSREYQEVLNEKWEITSLKHKRAWARFTKEHKKLFEIKK